jgi:hypothetical protein
MTTISATPRPDLFAVALAVTGAGGVFTVTAYPSGRDPYAVRMVGNPWEVDPAPVIDYQAPFGVPIAYQVNAPNGSAIVNTSLDVSGCVLSSTVNPGEAVRVAVLADNPHEWEARSAWFDVIGRRDPLVAIDVMRYRAGSWSVYAAGNTARRDLIDLVTQGAPVLLRTSVPSRIDDALALPMRMTESPHVDEGGGRVFDIDYQAVTRPGGPYAGSLDWTYRALLTQVPTYAAVPGLFDSYRALRVGPPQAPATLPGPLRVGT